MIKELSLMVLAGAFTAQAPGLLSAQTQPQTLTEYVEAANNGTLAQDPLVNVAANLCPVIAEAAEGQTAYAGQLDAACALLSSGSAEIPPDLLAMLN